VSVPLSTDQHARDELRRLAERATTGRWFGSERVEPDEFYGEYFELPATPKIYTDGAGLFASDEVGAFIAACDPQTVVALLARLDELESLLREIVRETPEEA